MAEITAALVKELREKSGAGMMDCKKALTENNGDVEAAIDWLRKNGLAAAAKKFGRVAADGLVGASVGGNAGALVEINSETDFVARNDVFQDFVRTVADLALANEGDQDSLLNSGYPGTGRTVKEQATHLIATIGENIQFRRCAALSVQQGVVVSYVHNVVVPNLGKIGVLVALESAADTAALEALGKQIAMHVAASGPQALSIEDLDPALVQREKDILSDQARQSGKPENIIEKMIEGRIRKYYEEVVLLQQTFVIDNETKIAAVIENAAKDLGAQVKLTGFIRMALGEGIEKEEGPDFAAEVKAAAGL